MSKRLRTIIGTGLVFIMLLSATLLLGPILLLALQRIFPLDWNSLNEIGQSYSGISALLSAAALLAVAASIRLQASEVRIAHTVAVMESQRELLKMALDDSDYLAAVFPAADLVDVPSAKVYAYNTMWLRYYELAFVTGNIDEALLRESMTAERFSIPLVRQHWEVVRPHWERAATDGTPMQTFVAILNSCYEQTPPPPPP
ncbi:MAG: DUF6082 family protein [Pseudonocardia sp.]